MAFEGKIWVLGSVFHELNLLEFCFHLEAPALIFGAGKQTAKWHFPNISAGACVRKTPVQLWDRKIYKKWPITILEFQAIIFKNLCSFSLTIFKNEFG